MSQEALSIIEAEDYLIIKRIRDQAPDRTSFSHLRKKIIKAFLRLKEFKIELISNSFFRIENTNWPLPDNLFIRFTNQLIQVLSQQMVSNPNRFQMSNNYSLLCARSRANWIEEEDNLLISIIEDAKESLNFAIISLCFPGRNGGQVYQRFRAILQPNRIKDPRCLEDKGKTYNQLLYRYFLRDVEQKLTEELLDKESKGIQVSLSLIAETANKWYRLPWVLAERACYQMFSKNGMQIYDDESTYTDEFKERSKEVEMDIRTNMYDEDEELDESEYNKFLQHFDLRKPNFSHIMINSFMKRNRISWRNAHYAKRALIQNMLITFLINLHVLLLHMEKTKCLTWTKLR